MEDEKKQRNVLELKVTKIRPESGPNPANLTHEDLGELLFDILQVPIKDCLAFDYNTGRYDVKQVKLKPGVPVHDIIARAPVTFKDHVVTVSQQRLNITRKLCSEMKTPRGKMSAYMNSLKISVGYSSLNAQYLAA